MKNKFWFVWNSEGNAPRYKHDTIESAKKEAERLAGEHAHCSFYVLEAVSVSRQQPVPVATEMLTLAALPAVCVEPEAEPVPETVPETFYHARR